MKIILFVIFLIAIPYMIWWLKRNLWWTWTSVYV